MAEPRFVTAAEAQSDERPLSVTKFLTNDQIIHLPTVQVEILPAQGENIVIIPVYALAILNSVAAGYTGTTNASWNLLVNNHYMTGELCPSMGGGNPNSITLMQFPIPHMTGTNSDTLPDFEPDVVTNDVNLTDEITNQALKIGDTWDGLTDYGGGDAANWLKIVCYYVLADISGP